MYNRKIFILRVLVVGTALTSFIAGSVLACGAPPSHDDGATPLLPQQVLCDDVTGEITLTIPNYSTFAEPSGSCACGLNMDPDIATVMSAEFIDPETNGGVEGFGTFLPNADTGTGFDELVPGEPDEIINWQGLSVDVSNTEATEGKNFTFNLQLKEGSSCEDMKKYMKSTMSLIATDKGSTTGRPSNQHLHVFWTPDPLKATFNRLEAINVGNGISLVWETADEIGTVAWGAWRAKPKNGKCNQNLNNYTKTAELLTVEPANGGLGKTASYTYIDPDGDETFCYGLQDIESDSSWEITIIPVS